MFDLWLLGKSANIVGFLQAETELAQVKSQAKMIFRRLNRNSAQQASIESGQYNLQ